MANILVTGASRGIGLELVKQLLDLPSSKVNKVFAVTRNSKAEAVSSLAQQHGDRVTNVVIEDITSADSVKKGVEQVTAALNGQGLDALVNNAGVMPWNPEGIASMSGPELLDTFNTNVVSVQVITTGFMPLLEKGRFKKILNVSTTLGSIAKIQDYAWAKTFAYKVTKAAMNMLTTQWALEYAEKGFTVFALSPGWLKTDLGSDRADLDVSVGVSSVKDMIFDSDQSWNGQFRNIKAAGWEGRYDGEQVPW